MTTYTTHMQIMTQLVAAHITNKGVHQCYSYDIAQAADIANSIIRKSQEIAPIPLQQSRGPG